MTLATQITLTATPLSAYFYALGVLHGGRGPRVIGGPVDVAMLGFGVGGLVAFGPFGQTVLGRVAGADLGPWHWGAWSALVGMWVLVFAGAASRRLAVYNVTADELDRAVREALAQLGGHFAPTLGGFEDPRRGWGVAVKPVRWLRAGSVEAYGGDAEALIVELKPWLRSTLGRVPRRPSALSPAMFGLAGLAMLVPVVVFFAGHPRAKESLRAFLQSLRWW